MVIIAYTAFDISGVREAAAAAVFDDYPARPFGFEELDKLSRGQMPRSVLASPASS